MFACRLLVEVLEDVWSRLVMTGKGTIDTVARQALSAVGGVRLAVSKRARLCARFATVTPILRPDEPKHW